MNKVNTATTKFHLKCMEKHLIVNLSSYFNNDGISYDELKYDGDFDGSGVTYPAEELPISNTLVYIDEIPFYFPSKEMENLNNMTLSNQEIVFPNNSYRYLYVLGTAEGQKAEIYEEEIVVTFADNTSTEILMGLSNWLGKPYFHEKAAFICSHMHFPDEGQKTNSNSDKNSVQIEEYQDKQKFYRSQSFVNWRYVPGDWKPKIWLQRVPLFLKKPIQSIQFERNKNFHIFAMTLEKVENNKT